MRAGGKSPLRMAACVYGLLWLPALAVASSLSLMGYVGTGFSPTITALVFLLCLPVSLLGLWSFRMSALGFAALFLCDLLTSAWPHVSFAGYFKSKMGLALFALTLLTLLIRAVSPFVSFNAFARQVRADYY
jgi:hypothetical protein